MIEMLEIVVKIDLLEGKFPNLEKVKSNVHANANIKKWLETRPVTEH